MKKSFWIIALALIIAIAGAWVLIVPLSKYKGDDTRVYISAGGEAWTDSLQSALGSYAEKVEETLILMRKTPEPGSYLIKKGTPTYRVAHAMAKGAQTPIRLTFNNVRLMSDLAQRISRKLALSDADFLAACDSVLPALGYTKEQFPAAFMPDTYEYYWTVEPAALVRSLATWRDKWWAKDDRSAKALALGMTEAEAATLASIVEEESNKADEQPTIARLYLNRLAIGMPLQADPTVKYAVGDFSLRRIMGNHLKTDSPYNTYQHAGLPPGPIRIPSQCAIDAVLNAPTHSYLYMCAKEDFSGRHNFATNLADHQRNARLYHQALDRRMSAQ